MSAMLLKPSKFALRSSAFDSDNKQEDDGGNASKATGDNASSNNFKNPFAKQLPETPKNVPEKAFVNPFLKTASSPSSLSLKAASSPSSGTLETASSLSSVTLKAASSPSPVSPSLLNNNTSSKPTMMSQEKTIKLSNNTRSLESLQPDVRNSNLYSKPILVPSSKTSNTIESSQTSNNISTSRSRSSMPSHPSNPPSDVVTLMDDEEVLRPERVVKQVVEFQAGGRRKETQRVVFKCKFCDSYFSDEVKANQHMKDVLVCDFPGCVINFHGKKDLDQASHPYNVHRRSHATDRHRMQDSRQAALVARWMEKYARSGNSSFNVKPGQTEGGENSSNRSSLATSESSNASGSTPFEKNLPLQKYLQKLITVHPSLKVVQERIVCSTCVEAKNVTEFARGVVIDRQIQKKVNEHFSEYSDKKSAAYLASHFASLQILENLKKKSANSGQNVMNRNLVGPPIDIADSPVKASNSRTRNEDDVIFNPKQKVAVSEKIMRKIERDPLLSKLEGFFEIKRSVPVQNNRMELIQKPMYNRQSITIGDSPMQLPQRSIQAKQIVSIQESPTQLSGNSMQKEIVAINESPRSSTTMRPEVRKRLLEVQNATMDDGSNKKQKTFLINKDSSTSVIEMASQNQPKRRQIINNQIVNVQPNSQNKQIMYLSNSPRDHSLLVQKQQQQSERLQQVQLQQSEQSQRLQRVHQQSPGLQQSVPRQEQAVYQIPIATQNLSKGNGQQQILDLDKLLAEGKIKGNQLVYTLET